MNFSMFGKDVLLKTDEDSSSLKIILWKQSLVMVEIGRCSSHL